MRFRVPAWYDGLMDTIAIIIFPSRKYLHLTLLFYFALMAAALVWWSGNWLWAPAVLSCAALAWILDRWVLH